MIRYMVITASMFGFVLANAGHAKHCEDHANPYEMFIDVDEYGALPWLSTGICSGENQQSDCVEFYNWISSCSQPKHVTEDKEFNPVAGLGLPSGNNSGNYRPCTGSMIQPEDTDTDNEWILTNAHCLREGKYGDWYDLTAIEVGVDIDVDPVAGCVAEQACVLKKWIEDTEYGLHDIGIVKLSNCAEKPESTLWLEEREDDLPDRAKMFGFHPMRVGLVHQHFPSSKPRWQYRGFATFADMGEGDTYRVCHTASVTPGSSGSPLVSEEMSGVFCVNSESGSVSRVCGDIGMNECAAVTESVKVVLERYMTSGDEAGLVCHQ